MRGRWVGKTGEPLLMLVRAPWEAGSLLDQAWAALSPRPQGPARELQSAHHG